MTRGYPDYSPGVARDPEGRLLQTLAEPPVWLEDSVNNPTLKWAEPNGTLRVKVTDAGALSPGAAYTGEAGLHLVGEVGDLGLIRAFFGIPPTINKVGFIMNFRVDTAANYSDSEGSCRPISISFDSGTQRKRCSITFNPNDGKWYFTNDGGANFTFITTYNIQKFYWHTIKLFVDFENNKYIELKINDQAFDLSDEDIGVVELGGEVGVIFSVLINSAATKQAEFWIDNFKVTYGVV